MIGFNIARRVGDEIGEVAYHNRSGMSDLTRDLLETLEDVYDTEGMEREISKFRQDLKDNPGAVIKDFAKDTAIGMGRSALVAGSTGASVALDVGEGAVGGYFDERTMHPRVLEAVAGVYREELRPDYTRSTAFEEASDSTFFEAFHTRREELSIPGYSVGHLEVEGELYTVILDVTGIMEGHKFVSPIILDMAGRPAAKKFWEGVEHLENGTEDERYEALNKTIDISDLMYDALETLDPYKYEDENGNETYDKEQYKQVVKDRIESGGKGSRIADEAFSISKRYEYMAQKQETAAAAGSEPARDLAAEAPAQDTAAASPQALPTPS